MHVILIILHQTSYSAFNLKKEASLQMYQGDYAPLDVDIVDHQGFKLDGVSFIAPMTVQQVYTVLQRQGCEGGIYDGDEALKQGCTLVAGKHVTLRLADPGECI